jgi:hypothetical protein
MKKIITTIVAAGVTFMFAVAPAFAAATDTGAAKTDVKNTQPAAKVGAEKAKVTDADKATDVKKDTKKKTAKKKAAKKAKAEKKAEKKAAAGDAGKASTTAPVAPAKK